MNYFAGLMLLLFFFSCAKKELELRVELQQAEELMWGHPDSALMLLEKMDIAKRENELNYATWCLLVTQARNKMYIEETSDSLINVALAYFEKQPDPLRKAQTFFYAGQVQREMNQIEATARYYVQALDEVKKTTDYRFACLICSNLGMLYAYRPELKEQAKAFLREANHYALQTTDSNYIANSFLELGRIYRVYEQQDSAIHYYEKAIRIAEDSKQYRALSIALTEVANLYTGIGELEKAFSCLQEAIELKKRYAYYGLEQSYLSLGNIYVEKNSYDSAVFYLEKALQSSNMNTRRDAYWYLSKVNKQNDYFDKAFFHKERYIELADSINEKKQAKEILEIKEKYAHEKLINENNQLKMRHDQWIKISLMGLLTIVLIVAALIYLYQRKLLNKERLLQQTKNKILQLFETIDSNTTTIEKNKELITRLSTQIEETENRKTEAVDQLLLANENLQREISEHKREIARYNDDLKKRENATFKLLSREKTLLEQLEDKSPIIHEIRQARKVMSEEQWQKLKASLDQLYNNYTVRLSAQYPELNEMDIRYCCFIKLNLSNEQIATLAAISPQSVIKRKQRIRDKINTNPDEQIKTVQALADYLSHF